MAVNQSFSPGKVIISGEHAVVAGHPAVVSSIDLGLTARWVDASKPNNHLSLTNDLYTQQILNLILQQTGRSYDFSAQQLVIDSNLPQSVGLGSSAAYAHAVILAVKDLLQLELPSHDIFQLVWQAENWQHGQSSGLDPAAVVYGGLFKFQKHHQQPIRDSINNPAIKQFQFWLIDSGPVSESRKELIMGVQEKAQHSLRFRQVMDRIGNISNEHFSFLNQGIFQFNLVRENQRLLEELEVVGEAAKNITRQVEKIGGVAKVIGTGGLRAGSGFLLAFHPDQELFNQYLKNQPWPNQPIRLGG